MTTRYRTLRDENGQLIMCPEGCEQYVSWDEARARPLDDTLSVIAENQAADRAAQLQRIQRHRTYAIAAGILVVALILMWLGGRL